MMRQVFLKESGLQNPFEQTFIERMLPVLQPKVENGIEQGKSKENRKVSGPTQSVSNFFQVGPVCVYFVAEGDVAKVGEIDTHGIVENMRTAAVLTEDLHLPAA
jgi:hypothetical protein